MSSFLTRLQRLIYRNRSITFTPTGTRFVLLTLAVGVAAVNTGNNLLYLILGMMLSLIIVSGILSEQSLRKISFEWRFPVRIFAQEPVPVEIRITNGKRFLPSYSFRVDEGEDASQSVYTFQLSAGQTTVFRKTTRFEKRGFQALPPLRFHTAFPFGFFQKTLIRPQTRTVLVYPRVLPRPPGIDRMTSRLGRDHEYPVRGSGATLHNLRDYTPRDDARGIHWKASARESKLLLKEYEREEDDHVHLVFSNHLPFVSGDRSGGEEQGSSHAPRTPALGRAKPDPRLFSGSGGRSDAPEAALQNFERAVELTASLAYEFNRHGYAVDLQTLSENADGPETPMDLDDVLKTLALIQPVYDSTEQSERDRINRRIAALARSAAFGGRRILILPSPDPMWDTLRGRYSNVLGAGEPRFEAWSRTGGKRP
ncbi:MAG TPA: DUF58 domain-containing protein [Nitrospiria bacterium]|nr:DUF58 domain-containing protein [Nitrospiria bacterium]